MNIRLLHSVLVAAVVACTAGCAQTPTHAPAASEGKGYGLMKINDWPGQGYLNGNGAWVSRYTDTILFATDCGTGELFEMTVEFLDRYHYFTNQGQDIDYVNNHLRIKGSVVGPDGVKYEFKETANTRFNYRETGSYVYKYYGQLVGQGPLNNYKAWVEYHVTVNANGELVVDNIRAGQVCPSDKGNG